MKRLLNILLTVVITGLFVSSVMAQTPEIEAKLKERDVLREKMANASADEYDALKVQWDNLQAEIKGMMDALQADKESKTNAIKFYNDGLGAIKSRRYQEAVDLFQKSIDLNPLEEKAYYMLGRSYQMLKKYDQALEAYNKATQMNSSHVKAHTAKGLLLSRMQRLNEAIDAFNNAVSIKDGDPGDLSTAYNGLGLVLYKQQKLDKAVSAYDQAVMMDAKNAEAYYNRGKVYAAKSDWKMARDSYKAAADAQPRKHKYHTALAESLNRLGLYNDAVTSANAAIAINSNYAPAWFELGTAYERLQKNDDAIKAYEKAMKDRVYRDSAEYQIKLIKGEI